ncbi:outer membrane protein assembly factor BamD [Elizabethkingia argentiflava]|uniref:Outer membrane protein assembly factor BamD n=1 Tax=Elizabethkingia argenteiflava TaxID=2681556 RepID=A0A845PX34_9FLAO|nr:outer membrane protein assembly factor BamD [Elizabethkingia argenteiflava]NAW52195.1 outer membrane protein assembly factor BamD [Elizabethkingia argenteiflava]
MKKILTYIILSLVVVSCNKEFDTALKSANKDVILKAANNFYEKKKWKQALELYDRLPNLLAGTNELADMSYKQAFANYYDRSYKLAGHQFKSFTNHNPRDPRREEAAYMAALCYYQDSRDYNLDQESTASAVNELQDFLNTYPNSERSKNIAKLVDELSYKLEFKAYENARQYYNMAQYKAADIAFENVLEDYPSTKLRPQIYNYIMKSKEQLAYKSTFDLKADRIENAIAFTRQVEHDFPNSANSKEATKIREGLEHERERFSIFKAEYDKKKAEREAKLKKIYGDSREFSTKSEEVADKVVKSKKKKEKKAQEGSASVETSSSGASFRIPRNYN